MRTFSLRSRLTVVGIATVALPLIIVGFANWRAARDIAARTTTEIAKATQEHFSAEVEGIASLATLADQQLRSELDVSRRVALARLQAAGGMRTGPADDLIEWAAKNQATGESRQVKLPRVAFGDAWLDHRVARDANEVPLVDEITRVTGGYATVFQRMAPGGDLLRVATSVRTPEGKRAAGTYIPAANPDGTPNAVVAAVLAGKSYVGRAKVVNQWMLTVYEPIKDARGEVTGALFVGLPEGRAFDHISKAVASKTVVGDGYAAVINARGENRGRWVIPGGGAKVGDSIWDEADADGVRWVQRLVTDATALPEGGAGAMHYRRVSKTGGGSPESRIVCFAHFADWDWVVFVDAPEREVFAAVTDIAAEQRRNLWQLAWVGAATMTGAAVLWMVLGRGIANGIARLADGVERGAGQVSSAAGMTSASGQKLADGASRQAASMEEAGASLEEIRSMTGRTAEHAESVRNAAAEASAAADKGARLMDGMSVAMRELEAANSGVTKILHEIDEIALQTNLLALNAAIEAARAGHAGAGFAVVADEVRELAGRCAAASRETAKRLGEIDAKSRDGVARSGLAQEGFAQIHAQVARLEKLVDEIRSATRDQGKGIEQITSSVSSMDRITQDNAAVAEESASAAEELSAQAVELNETARALSRLVRGGSAA